MTFGSLFAGIGGIDLGLERAGLACRWQVEIDPACDLVLANHWKHPHPKLWEWMMGFPLGWTDCVSWAMRSIHGSQS